MRSDIFVDTSGFYAALVRGDDRHEEAKAILERAPGRKRGFLTTDYVLDETATLLKARGLSHLLDRLFTTLDQSTALQMEWVGAARFSETRFFFLKHRDQAWSFTDCVSFCVMKDLRLRDALTKDAHFRQAGFTVLLG